MNQQFRNLCNYLNLLIYLNILLISKSKFENYYEDFILRNKYRIKSLHISDSFTIEYFSSSTRHISTCSKLEKLIIDFECLNNLLINLICLSNLSSLSLHINQKLKRTLVYQFIFALPQLKYCEIFFEPNLIFGSLNIRCNQPSSIQRLILNGMFYLYELSQLIPYIPKL